MGRPPSDLDDYLEWQQRLENQKASGLSIDDFCLQEGISKSTFYRWADRLREGIPESIAGEQVDREKIESGNVAFVPITLKASPVEIELPNGGIVRLPLGVGELVLVEVIRVVGTMRPWKGVPVMTNYSDVRIFLCTTPTDMHYSFDRLLGRTREIFEQDPLDGHLFLFVNRNRDRLKLLFWDQDGFCIFYKKLEAENTQMFGFTEVGLLAHNRGAGFVEAGRVA